MPHECSSAPNASLIIDGQALVVSLGCPPHAKTFSDFADVFVASVLHAGAHYHRIDVVFDRYKPDSVKQGTRLQRGRGMPIRRHIESKEGPLPDDWKSFLSLVENKSDLALFLSEELISKAPEGKTVIVAGGFQEENAVQCKNPNQDVSLFRGFHDEADTRIILHWMHSTSDFIMVSSRDTDVLLLLMAHYDCIDGKLWMKAGTRSKPKYIPVRDVILNNNLDPMAIKLFLLFHAITGSDTTSFL